MTKEEYINGIKKAIEDGNQQDYNSHGELHDVYVMSEVVEDITILSDEYAKQQSIAFSQFIYKSQWKQYNDNDWFEMSTNQGLITTEQLYDIFLKQQP